MKILLVVFYYDPAVQYGGPTINVRNLSRLFTERGHEVTIYCTNYLDYKNRMSNRTFEKKNKGVKIVYFNSHRLLPAKKGRHGLVVCPDLIARYDSDILTHDIIHINAYRTSLAMVMAWKARRLGIPFVIQARGTLEVLVGNIYLKKMYDFLYGKRMLKNASKIIALTPDERELYLKLGANSNNIELIPNGLDIENIRPKIKPGQFRQKLGISNDEKIILFLGRIHQTKGVDLLIKAFAKSKLKNTRLVIVGPDEGCLQLAKETSRNLGLSRDMVMLPGPIYGDDKFTAYYDSDVFVRSSFMEGLPMSVIESIVCGTPVVITKKCGLTDIVDKRVGFVVDYDVDMLSEALREIVSDDSLRRIFAGNTIEIAKKFDLNNVVDQLENLYRAISISAASSKSKSLRVKNPKSRVD